jgi:DNA-binding IclR family transcriptional regulator
MDILDLFLQAPDGLTVTAIATATQINKSTVVRLCATLEGRGYLWRNRLGSYFLGPQINRLSRVFHEQFNLETLVRPVLVGLRDETGESASLYVVDGDARVCLFRENSTHPIRHVVEEGTRLPFNKGVVGRVLRAFSGAQGAEFAKIRRDGHLDADGREAFTASVATPVLTQSGQLIGALVVSGLANRFDARQRTLALQLMNNANLKLMDQFPADSSWLA